MSAILSLAQLVSTVPKEVLNRRTAQQGHLLKVQHQLSVLRALKAFIACQDLFCQVSKAPQSMTVQRVSTVQMVQVLTGNSALQVPIVTGRIWYVSKTAQSVPLVSTVKAQTLHNQQATAVPVSTVYLEQPRQTPT